MKVSVIVIGDELLIGQVTDTNSGWIARHISPYGWEVNDVQTVGDNAEEIRRAIDRAFEAELDSLCGYITEYSLGDTPREVSPVSVDSALKSIDLMHFGWNIGKAFGKKRIYTATFIKNVFAHTLRDIEVSTIERKMSHTESECRIYKLINISLC